MHSSLQLIQLDKIFTLLIFFMIAGLPVQAQTNLPDTLQTKVLEIISAVSLEPLDSNKTQSRKLVGNVQMKQGDILFFCD